MLFMPRLWQNSWKNCTKKRVPYSIPRRKFHKTGARLNTLPQALLNHAKKLTEEHAVLQKKLQSDYNSKLARRAGELNAVVRALNQYQNAVDNLAELKSMLEDRLLDADFRVLAEEDSVSTSNEIELLAIHLRRTLVPKHRFAHLPAFIELRPGTGGSEAARFAMDLWRMYLGYCNARGWPVNIMSLDVTEDDEGLLEGIMEIRIDNAYDEFRVEAGVHRVQRIPATEKTGRVHTSTAIVMVLPSLPTSELGEGEEDLDAAIEMKDVRIDVMRARGAGGQHVNTTDSAVRMTHIPTGIVAAIQDSRSQHKNREKCLSVLKSRIAEKRRLEREAEGQVLRRGAAKVGAGRSDKLRTYNYTQNRITDHRAGFSLHDLPAAMKGDGLEKMIEEVKKWQIEQDITLLT